ncbi:MAG: hypothetical protein R2754_12250 [Microthrixaceae bacterium]
MAEDADEIARLRAENERLRAEKRRLEPAPPAGATGTNRGRITLSILLTVVATLLVPPAISGVWLNRNLTDTDRYVETVAPLVRDPAVKAALKQRVTAAIGERVDVRAEVAAALPERGQVLAAPIAAGLDKLIAEVVDRIIESDQFALIWDRANRAAHKQVVSVLTTSGDSKGVVEVDLSEVAAGATKRLDDLGVTFLAGANDRPLTFEILRSDDVAGAQSAFRLFDRLANILPWVIVLLYLGAVLAAPNRRKGLVCAASGLVAATVFLLVTVAAGRGLYLDALPTEASISANESIYDALTRFLRGSGRAVLAIGLGVLVISVVSGPSAPARGVRGAFSGLIRSLSGAAGSRGATFGAFGSFVANQRVALRAVVGTIALIVFVAQPNPSAGSVGWTFAGAALAMGCLEFIGRASEPDNGETTEPHAGPEAPIP